MSISVQPLSPSEAARRLGVSVKALRLYERRGLITPQRTEAGWRVFGPEQLDRAAEVVALRGLGFSLAQIARVLEHDDCGLEPALAAHQASLELRMRAIVATVARVAELRTALAGGKSPTIAELAGLARPTADVTATFELPWPWGGERFELRDIHAITYIVGPLGSGKTRFARCLAEALPNAAFLRLDRDGAAAQAQREGDASLRRRVETLLDWLCDDGAEISPALLVLATALEAESPAMLVVDMVEQDLSHATQEALIAALRRRGPQGKPLFLMTRSSAILDLDAVGAHEAIILCPANHDVPRHVVPHPGAPGYEAVATCLASPLVRARTEGVIAWRPPAA